MTNTTLTPKTEAGRSILAQIDATYGAGATDAQRSGVVSFMTAMLNVDGATREAREAQRSEIMGAAFDALVGDDGAGFDWVDSMLQNYTLAI